ncbi:MAG: PQQ-binding-like beta-propeller repeat protein, partial [Planctomycetes bacterium]|nr:PQQ-binding-like beta-propeller repeat protein [Planctomycetota bacterium]
MFCPGSQPLQAASCLFVCLCLSCAGIAKAESTDDILGSSGVSGGLVVHLGCGDGRLTAALRKNDRYLVHGLDTDAETIAEAREYIQSLGIHGKVSVDTFDGVHLPYADNLVNLIVADDPHRVSTDEMMRVLVPLGVAYIDGKRTVKPWPADIDEWTHFLHAADGNAVSSDMQVGKPERLRWVADPQFSRHHDEVLATSAMVTGGGRIFSIVDESPRSTFHSDIGGKFVLIARDAFNGLVLWKRPIEDWGWKSWGVRQNVRFSQPIQLPKRMVVDGGRLYVTLGWNAPVSVLDARTGEVVKVLSETEFADELLLSDGKLILSVYETPNTPANPAADSPGQARTKPLGIRKRIRVIDPQSNRKLWESDWLDGLRGRYDAVSAQTHLELTVRSGRVFAITQDSIVSFALRDGKPLWTRPRPEHPTHRMMLGVHMSDNCTVLADDERLFVAQPVGKLPNTFHTIPCDLYAYDAQSGKPLWMLPRKIGSFAWGIHADVFLIGGKLWSHEHIESKMRGADP